jgi:hypothetical protein
MRMSGVWRPLTHHQASPLLANQECPIYFLTAPGGECPLSTPRVWHESQHDECREDGEAAVQPERKAVVPCGIHSRFNSGKEPDTSRFAIHCEATAIDTAWPRIGAG